MIAGMAVCCKEPNRAAPFDWVERKRSKGSKGSVRPGRKERFDRIERGGSNWSKGSVRSDRTRTGVVRPRLFDLRTVAAASRVAHHQR